MIVYVHLELFFVIALQKFSTYVHLINNKNHAFVINVIYRTEVIQFHITYFLF